MKEIYMQCPKEELIALLMESNTHLQLMCDRFGINELQELVNYDTRIN